MKKYGAILLNALIVVLGAVGLCLTIFGEGFMNTGTFMYYTVQSNIFAMATAAVTVVFELRRLGGHEIPAAVQFLRLLSSIAITLTFLVFSLMLTPEMLMNGNGDYLKSPSNIFVHNLVPIGAILDWCLFGSAKKLKRAAAFCGMVPALLYVCYVYLCVGLGIRFAEEALVPYFFLDYKTYGWFSLQNGLGVAYWIVILAGVLAGLGFGFIAIVRRREGKAEGARG